MNFNNILILPNIFLFDFVTINRFLHICKEDLAELKKLQYYIYIVILFYESS
jgi:hypothetical protein